MFTDTVPTPLTYVEHKFPLWSDYSHYFIMTVPVHIYVYAHLLYDATFPTPPQSSKTIVYKAYLVGTYILHQSFCILRTNSFLPFFPRNRSCVYTAPLAPAYLVEEPIKSRSFFVPTFSRPSPAQLALSGRPLIIPPLIWATLRRSSFT